MISTPGRRLRHLAAAAAAPLLLVVSACSGGDENEPSTPEDALAEAKTQLDETSGVAIALTAGELPKGVDALVEATGVGTHAPAFEGDISVSVNNLSLDAPVIAVEGLVYAQLPFTKEYNEVDPANYGAPDPATLMDPDVGLSSWLTAVEGVEEGDETRDGDQVLTPYTGTLPGSAVAEVIPSATVQADFDATFSIDDEGRLVIAEVAGPFYGDAGDVEYTINLDDYGTDKEITAP
jgi:lipoprotein LprG